MAGPNLPTNRAVGTPDPAGDANVVHSIVNAFDTGLRGALAGQVLQWNGTAYAPATPAAGGGTGGGSTTVTVAATNTPAGLRANATYICDGVDDQVSIQSALDALPTTGGLIVLLAGDFFLSAGIKVRKHGTRLTGSGIASNVTASQQGFGTRLRVVAGFTDTSVVEFADTTGTNAISTVALENMNIDGGDQGTNVTGVYLRGHTSDVSRVRVSNMSGTGFRVEGYAATPTTPNGWATYDTMFSRCIATDNVGSGFHFAAGAQDDHMVECLSFNNDIGIQIQAASQQITNCHTYNNRINVWFNNNGTRTKIVNLKCEGAQNHGIWLDNTTTGTSDVQIVASNFKDNGEATHNTFDHISFGTGTPGHARTSIIGCNFSTTKTATGPNPRSAIYATGGSIQGLLIASCNFAGAAAYGTQTIMTSANSTLTASGNSYGSTGVGKGHARGNVAVANGGTITISLARVPTYYNVSATVAGQVATVTAATAAALTISLQTNAGAAVTTAATVTYEAEI